MANSMYEPKFIRHAKVLQKRIVLTAMNANEDIGAPTLCKFYAGKYSEPLVDSGLVGGHKTIRRTGVYELFSPSCAVCQQRRWRSERDGNEVSE
jgi:hypothetical protein